MTSEVAVLPLELRSAADMTMVGLAVPYGATTNKAGLARGERFVYGAFSGASDAARSIRLADIHDQTGKRPVGVATKLTETPEGLLSEWRFYQTPEGRGAYENVKEGTYGGLSVEFFCEEDRRGADGAREVIKARLHRVALVDEPAYEQAKVLAVRAALPDITALLAKTYRIEDYPEAPDLSRMLTS